MAAVKTPQEIFDSINDASLSIGARLETAQLYMTQLLDDHDFVSGLTNVAFGLVLAISDFLDEHGVAAPANGWQQEGF